MDFDWQGMLDFVVSCESELPRQKQFTQDHYFSDDSYGVAAISPLVQSADSNGLDVHTGTEGYQLINQATTSPFNPCPLPDNEQNDYSIMSHYNVAYAETELKNYISLDYLDQLSQASNFNNGYNIPFQIQEYPSPNIQQPSPNMQGSIHAAEIYPIKIEIVGYVDQHLEQHARKTTKKKVALKKRIKTYVSDWHCAPCDRSFKSKRGLVQHNNIIHSGPTPHGCDICGKKYKDINVMQQHRQRHLATDKPFKCIPGCPKQFFRFADLQRHADLHHGKKRYTCSICGKAFDRGDHVKDHELSHENGTIKKIKTTK